MRKKLSISFIGNSEKFVKIFKSIYPNAICNIYSWRCLGNFLLKQKFKYKSDIIIVCGYDYSSQWYWYQKYYKHNIIYPLKFIKMISKKKTKIIYMDTTNKISKNRFLEKRYTFSRYEFAKKELRKMILKNFKFVKILTLPILVNEKNKADVHGGFFTKKVFNYFITLRYVKTIKFKNLKKKIIERISLNKIDNTINLRPLLLIIPRSLFIDRILRFLND